MAKNVRIGDQVYAKEGSTMFGAVRSVSEHVLTIYVENAGDFRVGNEAVHAVHDGKVIVDVAKLEPSLQEAIRHAHEREG